MHGGKASHEARGVEIHTDHPGEASLGIEERRVAADERAPGIGVRLVVRARLARLEGLDQLRAGLIIRLHDVRLVVGAVVVGIAGGRGIEDEMDTV